MGKAKPGFNCSDSQEPVDHPQGEDIVIVIVILKVEILLGRVGKTFLRHT